MKLKVEIMTENNVIDIKTAAGKKKPRRILKADKEYKITGTLAILLIHFAKFMLRPEKDEMAFIGFVNTITKFVKEQKFEEVGINEVENEKE
jgi:hypothetical protein